MTNKGYGLSKPATEAQKNMIRNLRAKKATADNPIISDAEIDALKMSEVDYWKGTIFSMPWPTAKKVELPAEKKISQSTKFDMYEDIADANYAYFWNGKTHFYRVTRETPTKGKWAGYTFINVQERASSELYPIENKATRKAILETIRKEGPEACRIRFAERLGKCSRCFKDLTDEFNPYKSIGLGPDCGTKI